MLQGREEAAEESLALCILLTPTPSHCQSKLMPYLSNLMLLLLLVNCSPAITSSGFSKSRWSMMDFIEWGISMDNKWGCFLSLGKLNCAGLFSVINSVMNLITWEIHKTYFAWWILCLQRGFNIVCKVLTRLLEFCVVFESLKYDSTKIENDFTVPQGQGRNIQIREWKKIAFKYRMYWEFLPLFQASCESLNYNFVGQIYMI